MRIRRVRVRNFRRLGDVSVELHPGVNWVWGDNAAGKSSFLEALLALGRGRNHRGSPAEAVGPDAPYWRLEATALGIEDAPDHTQIVLTAGRGRSERRLDGRAVNQLALARQLPLALLEPASHELVGEGPAERRRFVDWGVFHVEHLYVGHFLQWQRLLKQRNAALRRGAGAAEITAWDAELVPAAEAVDAARRRHLEALRVDLEAQLESLVGAGPWRVDWSPGWPVGQPLGQALREALDSDRARRSTACGPQRAELQLRRADHLARSRVSRGEEKLVAAALLLAQRRLLQVLRGTHAILLVDDFASELGDAAQARLFAALAADAGQCVVADLRAPGAAGTPARVFHVEHGQVRPMVE